MLKYDTERREADPKQWIWERKKMFTAIYSSYLYPESWKNAALDCKEEWGCGFVCSDKNALERNAVRKDLDLSQ